MDGEERKVFGMRVRTVSRLLLVIESFLLVAFIGMTIVNLFGGITWLPFLMNSLFVGLSFAAIISMLIGFRRARPIYFLPMLTFESVSTSWVLLWVYASYTSGVEGNLWALEWLGGPQSGRDPIARDVRDPAYFDRSQTDPEMQRAIGLSSGFLGLFMILFFVKIVLWIFAKNTFVFYQEEAIRRDVKMRDFDPIFDGSSTQQEDEPAYTVIYRKNEASPTRVSRQKSSAQIIGSHASLHSPGDTHRMSQYFESQI